MAHRQPIRQLISHQRPRMARGMALPMAADLCRFRLRSHQFRDLMSARSRHSKALAAIRRLSLVAAVCRLVHCSILTLCHPG